MKINQKILSIPPYISTTWKNIGSLHVENPHGTALLIITLLSGTKITIPGLHPNAVEEIFNTHAKILEQEEKPNPAKSFSAPPLNLVSSQEQIISFGFPLKGPQPSFEMGDFGSLLQHNPELAESPDMPQELISKIIYLSKTIGIEDITAIPKAEPDCNCTHCQIARALHKGLTPCEETALEESTQEEEIVSDEDLKFKTWEISQTGEKLFLVANPLDDKEHYSVYLGEPVGCTCGEKHCEHIRAVLSS